MMGFGLFPVLGVSILDFQRIGRNEPGPGESNTEHETEKKYLRVFYIFSAFFLLLISLSGFETIFL